MLGKLRQHELIRMLTYLQPNIPTYLGLLFINALIVAILWNVILAFILKEVVDSAVQGEWASLQQAFLFACLALFAGVPAGCYVQYRISVYTRKTLTGLRLHAFRQMINLPLTQAEGQHSGDLISRLTNDLGGLHEFYVERISSVIFVSSYGIIVIGAIFRLDWRFGLISLLLGLITTRISAWFIPPMRTVSDAIQDNLGRLTERLVDLLQGLRVTKLFQIESAIHQAYVVENNALTNRQMERARLDTFLGTTDFVFGHLKSIGLLALGLYLLLLGYPIEVGTIAAIIYLQGIADYVFRDFGNVLTDLQKSLAGARRVLELLDVDTEQPSAIQPISGEIAPRQTGSQPIISQQTAPAHHNETLPSDAMILAENIRYEYVREDRSKLTALQNIELTIPTGQVAALVGSSGGGKSTLLKVLLGLYPIQQGTLASGGRISSTYSLAAWRDRMAYVPQEAYLFADTIAENIRYGKPTATEEEIYAAAQAANAHDFILEQPDGYDTWVGERGTSLSGGQRQRIAIARALLKDAPILLLDEATSALDSDAEQQVQEALKVLMQGRTTIAVAHRLSTIEHADRIYVMDNGEIVEEGTHTDLLARNGQYHQLYHAQFQRGSLL
ncbi:MAG: ABC transporter ATP-binding protein [Chloroflexota bacterium]